MALLLFVLFSTLIPILGLIKSPFLLTFEATLPVAHWQHWQKGTGKLQLLLARANSE
jgi:hypothetical protein